MPAATTVPSRLPPMSTTMATGAGMTRVTGMNARMLIARIGTKASRTRPRTSTPSTPSTPMTRIQPLLNSAMDLTQQLRMSAMFAVTSASSRLPPTSTATTIGARTARATGTNAPTMAARRSPRASRTKPHTPTLMTRIQPAMFAATSAPSHLQSTSTPTATGPPMVKLATTASAQMNIAPLRTRAG